MLNVKIEISSTDDPRYKEIIYGTYEVKFDINEMAKMYPRPYIFEKRLGRKAGITTDNRLAFLTGIQIIPKMVFGKPINPEDSLELE